MAGSIVKRLEALEQKISFRRSRMILYVAHANTTESDHEAFLTEIGAGGADLVVCVVKFGTEPVPPRIGSITPKAPKGKLHAVYPPDISRKALPRAEKLAPVATWILARR